MTTLFISDVHLSAERPEIVSRFLDFLGNEARAADTLYILGDFFDLWLGDDDRTAPHEAVIQGLAELTRSGVPVRVLPGNHDFLLGQRFERESGCRLLHDPTVIDVYGTPVLIMHGDSLCTDDIEYQKFRAWTRDPANQRWFLALPLFLRRLKAAGLRKTSRKRSRLKPDEIMDVNPQAVERAMREHRVRHFIHGHTHRPRIHDIAVDAQPATRIVLGDWYQQDSVLAWDQAGYSFSRVADLRGVPT